MDDNSLKFKIIFLGDQGVGKSSIMNRFIQDKFEENYSATIGLDFHSKNVIIDKQEVRLFLYDTAGQEKFKSLIPMYIRDANVILIVYDINNKDSFNHTNGWINELKDIKREDAIFALIGNKLDLAKESREVSYDEGLNMAKEKDFIFKEISAKDGSNVNDLFYTDIFDKISKMYGLVDSNEEATKQAVKEMNQGSGNIKLGDKNINSEKRKKPGFIKKFC